MHVFFSGIGGSGIGPLALVAHQAGFTVSGSDKQHNNYIGYLTQHGVTDIYVGQTYDQIAAIHAKQPIDWFVYTSALPIEQPDAPELRFCRDQGIRTSKRDEFINLILTEKQLKLVAIAGTHGKTTTTAMAVWLFKQLGVPISYALGAKLSFGDMGQFDTQSEYFVYEADEFDRNFLAFQPYLSIITGIDWDHPDIYPTRDAYNTAFREFLQQSEQAVLWQADFTRLGLSETGGQLILSEKDWRIDQSLHLPGHVNRLDAWQVAHAVHQISGLPIEQLLEHLNRFPGVSRRFEQIVPNLYSDYAHTPPKIEGALQLAHEVAGDHVVVVYEGLHNTRQHFIKEQLVHLFDAVKQLYIVPSYLAREDPSLQVLSPQDLRGLLSPEAQKHTEPAQLDETLVANIRKHLDNDDLVLGFSAGGGGSLDEWLRKHFKA
ncbi:MAG TPA: Mur ligase domain-containing protein [Nevskiaceae bacterium]|nr:Mur ligase domain-containing protein [Nevskiaceae bacterium]